MRKLLAILLLALAFSAQAQTVDTTIKLTPQEMVRMQVYVGKERAYKDTQPIPQPRDATTDEVKQFVIDRIRESLVNHERAKAVDAAVSAIVVPAFDPK